MKWTITIPKKNGWYWTKYLKDEMVERETIICPSYVEWIDKIVWVATGNRDHQDFLISNCKSEFHGANKCHSLKFGKRIMEPK